MSGGLRADLRRFLDEWREDLSPVWADFFGDAEPAYDSVSDALDGDPAFPIIPGRRGEPRPSAPAGAHVFRAFDGTDPAAVKVVVIGQDPYPRVTRATGRAFEDGAFTDWRGTVAQSLQRLMQSSLAVRLSRPELARTPADWALIRAGFADGSIPLEPLTAWFDRLQGTHGVLFVNAGWTLTKIMAGGGSPEQKAHIALWRPVMTRLLTGLAERPGGHIVYLLLGGFAKRLFADTGIEARARVAGTWGTRAASVVHPHPSAPGPTGYLASGNPMDRVNQALAAMSAPPVNW